MSVPTKLLSVRLPEAERRRIKALAASQGLTIGEAIREAFEAWASQLQRRGAALPGGTLAMALSVADLDKPTPQTGAPTRKPGRPARAAKHT
jgi:Ribbon-helix-helix protein, copG family